jgi:hypothetical protein
MESLPEGGSENSTDKPRKLKTIHRSPDETVKAVTDLRRETAWCPHRIAEHLRKSQRYISENADGSSDRLTNGKIK